MKNMPNINNELASIYICNLMAILKQNIFAFFLFHKFISSYSKINSD